MLEFTYKANEEEILLDSRAELAMSKLGWSFPEDYLNWITNKMRDRRKELKKNRPSDWGSDGKTHL